MAANFDAVKEATDSFSKLFKGRTWLLGAPMTAGSFLMIGIIVVVLVVFFGSFFRGILNSPTETPDVSGAQVALFAITLVIGVSLATAVNVFTYGWTLVAAEPIWLGGEPAFDRGFNRAAARLLQLLAFYILIILISIISLITIVGPLVVSFFAIYGPPAILLDGASATQAIGKSFRLASENIAETLILVLAFIIAAIALIVVQFVVSWIPIVGIAVSFAATWLLNAYVALAIVRFYDLIKVSGPPIPVVPSTTT